MSIVLLIVASVLTFDLVWWWRGDRLLRPLPRRWRKVARGLFSAFMAVQVGGFAYLLVARFAGLPRNVPTSLFILLFVWHLLIVAIIAVGWLATAGALGVGRLIGGRATSPAAPTPESSDTPATEVAVAPPLSRREFFGVAAAVVPPIVTLAAVPVAVGRMDDFRIRNLTVRIANLPSALDGMTIAHVTDSHVGQLTTGPTLGRIATATNDLDADLVLLTGDLINNSLDDLPAALEMVHAMRGRYGVYLCEGNHDLFEGRAEFEQRTKASGANLLVNESAFVEVNGHGVQLLGLPWGTGYGRPHGQRGDGPIVESMGRLAPQVRPTSAAFPILLAHHPHAFDYAAAAGIPLTLAGHTHGGQIMATRHFGAGNLVGFRYFSGLYSQGNHHLVVSNGVGNWFPIRFNAPAEIIRVELRRA